MFPVRLTSRSPSIRTFLAVFEHRNNHQCSVYFPGQESSTMIDDEGLLENAGAYYDMVYFYLCLGKRLRDEEHYRGRQWPF
jgi:hypothetical protein